MHEDPPLGPLSPSSPSISASAPASVSGPASTEVGPHSGRNQAGWREGKRRRARTSQLRPASVSGAGALSCSPLAPLPLLRSPA